MKLQQPRFLDAVVSNNLNVSAAAGELYTSQPGVSHQIKLLEDELEIQLFERSGKKLTALSPAGHAIMGHVNERLNSARNIKQAARKFSKSNSGSLAIATTRTQTKFIVPPILLRQAQVPNFGDLQESLKLQAVGQADCPASAANSSSTRDSMGTGLPT